MICMEWTYGGIIQGLNEFACIQEQNANENIKPQGMQISN